MMFVHQCSACHRRQLIFPSQLAAIAATDSGVSVTFTCWCGSEESSRLEELPVAA